MTREMECPVCFSNKTNCTLTCGHSFCMDCVKNWWMKSNECNCPMCRKSMYFRGMNNKVKEWNEEREHSIIQSAYSKLFDEIYDILEESEMSATQCEFAMMAFMSFEERFNSFVEYFKEHTKLTEDFLIYAVSDPTVFCCKESDIPYYDCIIHDNDGIHSSKGKSNNVFRYTTPRGYCDEPLEIIEILITF